MIRSFFAMVIMVSGGVVFGRDPSDFGSFTIAAIPGTTVVAGAMLIIGLAIWLHD